MPSRLQVCRTGHTLTGPGAPGPQSQASAALLLCRTALVAFLPVPASQMLHGRTGPQSHHPTALACCKENTDMEALWRKKDINATVLFNGIIM